jgi:hypothetical protein
VALGAANIRRHRAALGGVPLAVENPVSYLPPAPGEWADGDFMAMVAETADCGILLDLHNVMCNARNGRQSVAAFCNVLPLERVWELHLAGGETRDGFYLDAHAGLVDPEVMEITASLMPRLVGLRAMIFEIMPERIPEVGLAAIGRQLGQMQDLWNTRGTSCAPGANASYQPPSTEPSLVDPEAWETLLGCAIHGRPHRATDDATADWWRSAAPALKVYQKLVGESRASAVATAAPRTTRVLLTHCGGAGTRQIFAEFWCQSLPGYTSAEEARALFRFLRETRPYMPGLADAVASDADELDRLCNFTSSI